MRFHTEYLAFHTRRRQEIIDITEQVEAALAKSGNARKGPWRMAAGPLNSVLTIAYWQSQGLISLVDRYLEIRQLGRTAWCGPACQVV